MSSIPALGPSVPSRRNPVLRAAGRAILRLMGWRVEGSIPDQPKLVIAVAPHTSNWDFIVGIAAMFAMDLKLAFLGKHTLFRGLPGVLMRWLGGIPVDRSSPHGVVGDAIAEFERCEARLLAIAPQGTRKPTQRFKSGFLHIARGARVPILLATLDWGAHVVRMGPVFEQGDDPDTDLRRVEAFFAGVRGRKPRDAESVLVPPRTKA